MVLLGPKSLSLLIFLFSYWGVHGKTIPKKQPVESSDFYHDNSQPLKKINSKTQAKHSDGNHGPSSSGELSNCFRDPHLAQRKTNLVNEFNEWIKDDPEISKDFPAAFRSLENLYELPLIDKSELKTLRNPPTGVTCTADPCGKCIITSMMAGIIQSPNFPFSYGNNASCTYTLEVPEGKRIELTFTKFSVEEDYDFVTVYDQTSVPLRVNLNGYRKPKPIVSKTNVVRVSFRSDLDNIKMPDNTLARWEARFNIYDGPRPTPEDPYDPKPGAVTTPPTTAKPSSVTCKSLSCDGVCKDVTSSGGIIQSPDYPGDYGNHRNCMIHMRAPPGKIIRLNFTTFSVAEDCDFLFVYGDTRFSPDTLLQSFLQGYSIPPPSVTKANEMVVLFLSDEGNESFYDEGNEPSKRPARWQATFEVLDPPIAQLAGRNDDIVDGSEIIANPAKNAALLSSDNFGYSFFKLMQSPKMTITSGGLSCSVTSCGICQDLTATGGTIQSPDFPSDYGMDRDCLITIDAPEGYKVRLDFDTFVVEGCCDSLFIYDGTSTALQIQLNGFVHPRPSLTRTNQMNIRFISDFSNTQLIESGRWRARFELVKADTTPQPTTTTTSTTSTTTPKPDTSPTTTTTTTTTTTSPIPDTTPTTTTTTTTTTPIPDTTPTTTTTTTTPIPDTTPTTTTTTTTTPIPDTTPTTTTTTTTTTPEPDTTPTLPPIRVLCNISACGIHVQIKQHEGTIESPNYPNDYGHNLDCLITIEVPEGKTIDFHFIDFLIEKDYDVISIYDRISTPLRLNLNGHRLPAPIKTKTNKMTIVFKTDPDNTAIAKKQSGRWKAKFHIED